MSTLTAPDGGAPVLPPKRSRTPLIIAIAVAAVLIVVAGVLVAVNLVSGNKADARDGAITSGLGSPSQPVRIGTVGASEPYWKIFADAAKDAGISVKVIDFADYPQPNPALAAGELDLNQFQHIVYLAQNNAATGDDIVPVGSTAIYPLGLYSTKYKSVGEIPAGSTVAIPDDPSNLARALLVLQSAKLITLTGTSSPFVTLDQVDQANSKVKVTTLEAALTATSLPDVAAAIINNDFVKDAGLKASDAIAQDDPSDPNAIPYVNIWAANAKDKDNPVLLKVVKVYQDTKKVLDSVQETSGGTAVFLKVPVSELDESLKKVTAETKAQPKG